MVLQKHNDRIRKYPYELNESFTMSEISWKQTSNCRTREEMPIFVDNINENCQNWKVSYLLHVN